MNYLQIRAKWPTLAALALSAKWSTTRLSAPVRPEPSAIRKADVPKRRSDAPAKPTARSEPIVTPDTVPLRVPVTPVAAAANPASRAVVA